MRETLLLLGAGHAHLATLHALGRFVEAGIEVQVIDPHRSLWYSGMVPAALGGRVAWAAAQIHIAEIVERNGATFLQDSVQSIDRDARTVRLKSGRELAYTRASVAVGSAVETLASCEHCPATVGVKPMPELLSQSEALLPGARDGTLKEIVVLGGGPSGVEIAGALAHRLRETPAHIRLVTRSERLMARLPERAGDLAAKRLASAGVEMVFRSPATELVAGGVRLLDGTVIHCDCIYDARGLVPQAAVGSIPVDRALSSDEGHLFAGGDCAEVDDYHLARVGVHAVFEGPVIRDNLLRAFGLQPYAEAATYTPPEEYLLLIHTGDGYAIAVRGTIVLGGYLWYTLKERIDWAFVRSQGRSIRPSFSAPPRPGR